MGRVEEEFAAELAAVRPDLSAAYTAALPGARAAVLARLWRSLLYEPLPGVTESPGIALRRQWATPDTAIQEQPPPVPAARRHAEAPTPPPGGREWGGPAPEPLDGPEWGGAEFEGSDGQGWATVVLGDGRRLSGRARLPYDLRSEPVLWLDGQPWTRPAELLAALKLPGADRLAEDLDNSVASLALSRASAAARPNAPTPTTPEDYEQSVVDGHPYHPGCRNRPGVSAAEQLAYMPEHHPVVALDLVAIPATECLVSGPWPAELVDGDRLLLPVHPWQTRHVLPGLGLRPYATGVIPARPLMSVRTLAPLDGGPHLKTAFSTRMTSGVRDISPGSIRDCVALSTLLTDLSARSGGRPRVARYLAGAAAAVKGEFSADLSVMLREPTPAGATVLPVAAVTRELAGDPTAWLTAFARLAFADALGLLALGAALEAHGQNLLIVLDGARGRGRPSHLIYRDLADVRLSPARLTRNGLEVPPVSARLLTDDPGLLRAKLYGSLVGTTFGSLISLFCAGDRAAESRLWAVVAAAAREAFDGLPDGPDVRADRDALFGPHLTVKAHLAAQLEDAPPGDTWTRLPNPL